MLPTALALATLLAGPRSAAPAEAGAAAQEPRAPSAAAAETTGGDAVAVGLGALRETPAGRLGERVAFTIHLDGAVERWEPWLTRFGAAEYEAFSCWPDERFPWERAVYEAPFRRLFCRRGSGPARILRGARRYDRFAVVAEQRATFLHEPWLEVVDLRVLDERIPEGAILHASRGIELLAESRWDRAIAELERAIGGPLPEHARAELARLVERCRREKEAFLAERRAQR